jgi:hypothetical protein
LPGRINREEAKELRYHLNEVDHHQEQLSALVKVELTTIREMWKLVFLATVPKQT